MKDESKNFFGEGRKETVDRFAGEYWNRGGVYFISIAHDGRGFYILVGADDPETSKDFPTTFEGMDVEVKFVSSPSIIGDVG